MNSLTFQLCRHLRSRVHDSIHGLRNKSVDSIKVNNIIKRCSHVYEENKSEKKSMQSTLFPDYTLVYHLPHIVFVRLLNRLKRNCTFAVCACIPLSMTAQMLDFISLEECLAVIISCSSVTLPLHVTGYLTNNVIGSICIKDKENIVISYVDYWGTRIDMKTVIKNVEPLAETNNFKLKQLFKYLQIISPKKKLKLYLNHGKIDDTLKFSNIVGDY